MCYLLLYFGGHCLVNSLKPNKRPKNEQPNEHKWNESLVEKKTAESAWNADRTAKKGRFIAQ